MKFHTIDVGHTGVTENSNFVNAIANGNGQGQRIGSRIKIWHIDGVLRTQQPVRLEVLKLNSQGSTFTNTIDQPVDRDECSVLKHTTYNPNVADTYRNVYTLHCKVGGLLCKYTSTTGTSINEGKLLMRTYTAPPGS